MSPPGPTLRRAAEAEETWFAEGCHILETWNRPDDPALSVARARVGPGVTTRRHRLRGIAERYLLLSGAGRVEVGEEPAAEVGPGDLVYIPPGVTQRITNTGSADLIFLALCTPRFTPETYEDVHDP